jgi:hypothetical protein
MSIKDQIEKIKLFIAPRQGQGVYLMLLIILVATSSFGLGRLSKTAINNDPVSIEYNAQTLTANAQDGAYKGPGEAVGNSSDGQFVASKRGKKYYPIDCPAGSSLKTDNKVFFNNEAEASAAGYSRSSSC